MRQPTVARSDERGNWLGVLLAMQRLLNWACDDRKRLGTSVDLQRVEQGNRWLRYETRCVAAMWPACCVDEKWVTQIHIARFARGERSCRGQLREWSELADDPFVAKSAQQ